MKASNRKAKSEREPQFDALEAYANLGVTPEDWKRFRLKYPNFFPPGLSDWFYDFANNIYEKFKDYPAARAAVKPPLLFYSERLRMVWSHNDPSGANLRFLYGLEKEAGELGGASLIMPADWRANNIIPGQPSEEKEQTTKAGLPPGRPVVNAITGGIDWEFGCELQQSVYQLMQQRWRTMVCPECGKFFLADKPNQKFCSTACFGEVKRKRALAHWRARGSEDRRKKMATQRKRRAK